jgi:hypothetical protein
MIHMIANDVTLAVSSEYRTSYSGPTADAVVLRSTAPGDGTTNKLHSRMGQIEVTINIVGPEGITPVVGAVSGAMLATLSDYNGGEAYLPTEEDDFVCLIPLGHVCLTDGEELEVVVRHLGATYAQILDIAIQYGATGPSRILQYQQSMDYSSVRGDVHEIWIFDYSLANGQVTLNSIEDKDALVTVKGGKVMESVPLEFLEALTRIEGEMEQSPGAGAKVYDSAANASVPLNVSCEIVGSATGQFRTLWVSEKHEAPNVQAKRARREMVEINKVAMSVPTDRTAGLVAKGVLSAGA